jgi:hypothetical protein
MAGSIREVDDQAGGALLRARPVQVLGSFQGLEHVLRRIATCNRAGNACVNWSSHTRAWLMSQTEGMQRGNQHAILAVRRVAPLHIHMIVLVKLLQCHSNTNHTRKASATPGNGSHTGYLLTSPTAHSAAS